MKVETLKYLKKRKQIIAIIESVDVKYQASDEEGSYETQLNVGYWEAKLMAEKILACMGINKPTEISKVEGEGYSVG